MENIMNKLNKIDGYKNTFDKWSFEEKKKLLDIYFIICKQEAHLFDLVYSYHGTDGFEDIFREYDARYLQEKATGVEMAIDEMKNIENGYQNEYSDTDDDKTDDDK
jgi:hypothetical protein